MNDWMPWLLAGGGAIVATFGFFLKVTVFSELNRNREKASDHESRLVRLETTSGHLEELLEKIDERLERIESTLAHR